jgi:hypothetical protein
MKKNLKSTQCRKIKLKKDSIKKNIKTTQVNPLNHDSNHETRITS